MRAGFELRRRGFSVLELLVSMAIIATLLMIAIPTYRDWSVKTKAAAVRELIHNIDLGVAQFITSTGNYPEADGVGISPWGRTPASLTNLLKDADFNGPGEITLAYWYLEPPHSHGPPQLRQPPHPYNGHGLHLGWADNSAPQPLLSTQSSPQAQPLIPAPGDKPPVDNPPANNPPGDKPPGDKPTGDKPPVTNPSGGGGTDGTTSPPDSSGTSGSTGDKHPVIFGGPGSSGDCDPAVYDDCGPGQPPSTTNAPDNPPRIGYVAVRAGSGDGQAVLKRLLSLFPPEQVRPLDSGPEVILVLLQE